MGAVRRWRGRGGGWASVPRQGPRWLLEEFTPFLRGGARVART